MKNSKNNKRGLWLLILGLSILFGGVFLYFYIVSGFGECRLGESINFKGKYYQSCAPIGTKVELANTYRLKRRLIMKIEKSFPNELADIEINRWLKIAKP